MLHVEFLLISEHFRYVTSAYYSLCMFSRLKVGVMMMSRIEHDQDRLVVYVFQQFWIISSD